MAASEQREQTENDRVPYEVPFEDISEAAARDVHREWYWKSHDIDSYECPDCGRGADTVSGFDVHHKDQNPLNGAPENLVALCRRCHAWRHHGATISGLDVHEWEDAFLRLAE